MHWLQFAIETCPSASNSGWKERVGLKPHPSAKVLRLSTFAIMPPLVVSSNLESRAPEHQENWSNSMSCQKYFHAWDWYGYMITWTPFWLMHRRPFPPLLYGAAKVARLELPAATDCSLEIRFVRHLHAICNMLSATLAGTTLLCCTRWCR